MELGNYKKRLIEDILPDKPFSEMTNGDIFMFFMDKVASDKNMEIVAGHNQGATDERSVATK